MVLGTILFLEKQRVAPNDGFPIFLKEHGTFDTTFGIRYLKGLCNTYRVE
jgi:hypothetical protein